MGLLDPDPYWEYGFGSGSRTVKMVSKNGKKICDFKLKRVPIDRFAEGLMVLT